MSATPKYFVTAPKVGRAGYVANVIYEIKFQNLNYTPSDECVELRFFSVQEAQKEDLFPQVAAFIKIFNLEVHA